MTVSSSQRFSRSRSCPICGGYDRAPRHKGIRCFGFLSDDGSFAHCTRSEYSRGLSLNHSSDTYAHRLSGSCQCGASHGERPAASDNGSSLRRIVDTYDYKKNGTLLFQAVRYEPKGFGLRRPDGKGDWIKNLEGVPRPLPLYRVDEIPDPPCDEWILIPEGEKHVNRLRDEGLLATTSAMGAGKFHHSEIEPLRGHKVALLPDNDEPGRLHVLDAAQRLHGLAKEIRMIDLHESR